MDQRIDPNSQPVHAAGTDPGFIPGLMVPRPVEDEESAPEHEAKKPQKETAPQAAEDAAGRSGELTAGSGSESGSGDGTSGGTEAEAASDAAPTGEDEPGKTSGKAAVKGAEDNTAEDAADGPAFEVSDRRASITADRDGVRFTLDDEAADFRWDEIGAVEVGVPRFGRRFTVTVHTITRRRYHVDVDAPARSALKEWSAELDEVLDAYFEEA
ncbi:hypothetical protein ACIO1C_16870 [Streptomyces sp. NPDC087420]|uniref:hypothetical protein n=1 Tax=Streptomyces sp. NPDC087420 TaxID=3365785 RepID=UPI00383647D1